MYQVYTCLTQEHDLSLVLAAVAICLLACYTAFSLLPRAAVASARARPWWIWATATAIGGGVWATHFVAMLAFSPDTPIHHGIATTSLSILIAIGLSGAGLLTALRGGQVLPFAGGALVGLGIAAMHYVGMAGWETQGVVLYDSQFVIASVLIGALGSSLAIAVGVDKADAPHRIVATLTLVLTIAAMHFTGVASATILPDPSLSDVPHGLPNDAIAVGVSVVTTFIMALGLAGAILDERLASYFAREAAQLKEEITLRKSAQDTVLRHRDTLEREVASRTADLAASEARLADAIEALPEAFVLFDAEDRLVVCNERYRALSGTTQIYAKPGIRFEELIGHAVARGDHSVEGVDLAAWMRARLAQHHAVGTEPQRIEQRRPDGRWFEIHEKRLRDGSLVALQIDVTEIRSRMEKLADRDKLTALGQLAGGVAHEINNLLQPALVYPELIRDALPAEDSNNRELLEVMEDGVRKAREIVRNVLTYARKEKASLEQGDLAIATTSALKLIRGLLPSGIQLQEEGTKAPQRAVFNPAELAQVLSNLVLNAAHASDQRGTVTLALDRRLPGKATALKLGLKPTMRYATLSVSDRGHGMDAATLNRIFEPFFTTKPLGVGTGLGLSVVLGIVRSWNGAIDVESAPGEGTRFTVYIPAEEAVVPIVGDPAPKVANG